MASLTCINLQLGGLTWFKHSPNQYCKNDIEASKENFNYDILLLLSLIHR